MKSSIGSRPALEQLGLRDVAFGDAALLLVDHVESDWEKHL